jgi:hypothetical protein
VNSADPCKEISAVTFEVLRLRGPRGAKFQTSCKVALLRGSSAVAQNAVFNDVSAEKENEATSPAFWNSRSVRGRLLNVIDDQDVNRPLNRLQLQAKLLPNGCKQGRPCSEVGARVCGRRGRHGGILWSPR